MADRLVEDTHVTETVGAYTLHIRRLVGLFVGIGVAEIVVMVYPTVYDTSRVNSLPVFWILMVVVLPAVIAGCGAAVGLWMRRSRSRHHCLNEYVVDRVISGGFISFLILYSLAVGVTAFVPIFPTFMTGQLAARTQPLTGLYIAAAAASIVLTHKRRVAYMIALAPLLLMMHATSAGQLQPVSIKEVSLDLTTNLASVGVLAWVLRQAGALDDGSAQYHAQAVALAADRARSHAQRRANSFIHDHILSALIAVANGLPDRAALRASARQALDSLSTDAAPTPVAAGVLLNDIVDRVGAMSRDICTNAMISGESQVPPEVAQAITEATMEAVRNSLRHAGNADSPVVRTVTLTGDAFGITVEVDDDGCGFDPVTSGRNRHGVSGSIITRMRDAGGEASIRSAPNQGATVILRWTPLAATESVTSAADADEAVAWSRYLASSMESVGARLIGVGLIGVHIMMVVHECYTDQYRHWEPVMLSLVIMLVSAVLLLWTWKASTSPGWVAWLIVVSVGVANLLVLNQIITTGWPGYGAWCTGAGTDLCCVLIIRGRPRQAWAGIGVITLAISYWVVTTGRPPLMIVTYTMGHYFMITAWQGIAHLSTRATTRIAATQRETVRLQAQQRAHEEADRIMTSRMASVRQRVTPLLTQIANGRAPTSELRSQAYLLEAELRDEIRAPFFTGTSIVTSAQAARRRGTEVILLDDSGDNTTIDGRTRANAVNYVTKFLDLTQSNRVVIRLNPPRRPTLLTIVTDDTRYRLDRQGELMTESAGGQVN